MPTASPLSPNRGGPRPRGQGNGHNGLSAIENKLGVMSIRDVSVTLLNFMGVHLNFARTLHAPKMPSM